ncbi:MAG: hypothetical protein OXF25_03800 [Cyanobacteria bacterium MAG CAR3_bin_5]|nr:hypothetical protein [Cyanobacteria bacterium MAG CAR3_bin_5]
MSIPANPTEKPSIAKVWRQVKGNAWTFATIMLGWWLMTGEPFWSFIAYQLEFEEFEPEPTRIVLSLISGSIALIVEIIGVIMFSFLITAVPVIYYTRDRCPKPGEIVSIIHSRLWRYIYATFMFGIVFTIGFFLCIVPSILVGLTWPIYINYIVSTDLSIRTSLSKAFKGLRVGGGSFLMVSILLFLADSVARAVLWGIPPLVVLPMTKLYMQNYIHHKGLVRARELA